VCDRRIGMNRPSGDPRHRSELRTYQTSDDFGHRAVQLMEWWSLTRRRPRAFEIFQSRGAQDGHDLDDWLQAERDLRGLPRDVSADRRGERDRRGPILLT
jgi:hypothetical protein